MKKHVLLLMCVLSITSELAFAGAGTYITIINNSNQDAHIRSLNSVCWYPNDLENNIIKAHETKILYTELVNSGGCNVWVNREWSQWFSIEVESEIYTNLSLHVHGDDVDRGYYELTFLGHDYPVAAATDFSPMSGTYKWRIVINPNNIVDFSSM